MPSSLSQEGGRLESTVGSTELDDTITVIKDADIVLHLKDERIGFDQKYRCSIPALRKSSRYMDILLDPHKFREGVETEAEIRRLSTRYDTSTSIPSHVTSTMIIYDLGEVTHDVTFMTMALKHFLIILHGLSPPWPASHAQSVHLIAILAILADRFSALDSIQYYFNIYALDKVRLAEKKSGASQSITQQIELEARQKILAGLILGYPEWVRLHSATLIVGGSKRWVFQDAEGLDDADRLIEEPLWWRLPRGIEGRAAVDTLFLRLATYKRTEELMARREYVLATIGSIQSYFIGLYSSKELQCKMGYGNSKECDSFQLGEMIRFFMRKRMILLQTTFVATDSSQPYTGNIQDLLSCLRECPEYQLDPFHSHCGLRTRLIPLLSSIKPNVQTGISLPGWNTDRVKESWLDNPTDGTWRLQMSTVKGTSDTPRLHEATKAMYTARHRDWTPSIK